MTREIVSAELSDSTLLDSHPPLRTAPRARFYLCAKRGFDIGFSLLLMVPLSAAMALLLVLNPIFNPGPMFFVQLRMGKDCRAFRAYKLRTMRCAARINRGPDDPVEHDRITALGRLLRQTRFDELPQILNVLRGDMSLIGPRPDYLFHPG